MYFGNENNFFDYNIDDYFNFDSNIINYNRESSNEVYDALDKGNFFKGTYSKYKNHLYKLKVNNSKDRNLLGVQAYGFVLKDLNLYLDTHPNDTEYLKLFKKYKEEYLKLYNDYVLKYGPLNILDVDSSNRWMWTDNMWPWDKGEK